MSLKLDELTMRASHSFCGWTDTPDDRPSKPFGACAGTMVLEDRQDMCATRPITWRLWKLRAERVVPTCTDNHGI